MELVDKLFAIEKSAKNQLLKLKEFKFIHYELVILWLASFCSKEKEQEKQ